MSLRSTYTPTAVKGASGERSSSRASAGDSGEKKARKKVNWSSLPEIWALIQPRRGILYLGFVLLAINRVAGLVLPGSTKYLLDNVIGKHQKNLLLPLVLELTAGQQVEYSRIAEELARMGLESEPFGQRTIAIKAVPAGVGPGDVEKLVFEILEISEHEMRKSSLADLRRNMAASIACRAAIKINTRLDQSKMEWLLRELAATDCPMSCPHGRPIALRYSMKDILKSFHRI